MTERSMQARLQRYYAELYPRRLAPTIDQLEIITTGWESDLVRFVATYGTPTARQQEQLILRMLSGASAATKAKHEAQSIATLRQLGYPVPHVYDWGERDAPFGKSFLLMDSIAGADMLPLLEAADPPRAAQLLQSFCHLFWRLHQLPWQPFVLETQNGYLADPFYFIDRWLQRFTRRAATTDAVDFRPIFGWVEAERERAACPAPAPTHNDYHPNNVLVRADDSCVVIDWTSFAITDPRFDLGWTLLLAQAHIGPELRATILQGYLAARGEPVVALEIFEVTAAVRRLLDLVVAVGPGAEAAGMRASAVEQMRGHGDMFQRVYEQLHAITNKRLPAMESLLRDLGS